MTDYIYLRVSTEEQDEKWQLDPIVKTFNCDKDKCLIFQERMTAFNQDKEHKRLEFLKLKEQIKKGGPGKLYIFALDRLFRNRKKTIEFFNYCKMYDVDIYSYTEQWLLDFQNIKKQMPGDFKFMIDSIYDMMLNMFAQMGESESKNKSNRVKKAINKSSGITKSVYGKKWGRKNLSKQLQTKIIELHKQGLSQRKIRDQVFIYDEHGNKKKNVSLGTVNNIIKECSKNQPPKNP
jgi:DNA invertase Pin-like site-specific DNA recombinase